MKGLSIYHKGQDLLQQKSFDEDLYKQFSHQYRRAISGIEMHFFEFETKMEHSLYSEYTLPGYKITLCLNGYSENHSPDKEYYSFEAGKALIYRLKEGRSVSSLKEKQQMKILHLYLPEFFFEENRLHLKKDFVTIPHTISLEQVQHLMRLPASSFYEKAQAEARLFELLSTVLVHTEKQGQANGLSRNVFIARDFLDTSNGNFVTIQTLSKIAGMNEYQLKKEFKQLTGKGIFSYQQEQRMEQAFQFLVQGHTVEEVALMVGYSSAGNFSNSFFKKYGYRPGAIKKS